MPLFGLKTFRHGVHPPEAKDETRGLPIRQFPFAPLLVVSLEQHLGAPALAAVRDGEEVRRGQVIGQPDGRMSVAVHAPASGVVRRVALAPTIGGRMRPAVYLEPFPGSTQEIAGGAPCGLDAPPAEILAAIQAAGIVGLGGAAFPTHVKLTVPPDRRVDALIVNGVECEPYLTTDHRVMLEQRDDIFVGLRYLFAVSGARRAIIAVEANKRDAADHLRAGLPADLAASTTVDLLRVKYPQGAEKMLVSALLDREVPSGRLPLDVGALCTNVATTAEIGRLLPRGRGIVDRVVTVGGPAVRRKGNYRVPIGTPLRYLLDEVGLTGDVARVFLGGPMMGQAASSLDIAVTKGVSGVIAFTAERAARAVRHEFPCIRCASCVAACPMGLDPAALHLLARNEAFARMAGEQRLADCFECGACAFACPAHIPLVAQFRVAKAALRKAAATAAGAA